MKTFFSRMLLVGITLASVLDRAFAQGESIVVRLPKSACQSCVPHEECVWRLGHRSILFRSVSHHAGNVECGYLRLRGVDRDGQSGALHNSQGDWAASYEACTHALDDASNDAVRFDRHYDRYTVATRLTEDQRLQLRTLVPLDRDPDDEMAIADFDRLVSAGERKAVSDRARFYVNMNYARLFQGDRSVAIAAADKLIAFWKSDFNHRAISDAMLANIIGARAGMDIGPNTEHAIALVGMIPTAKHRHLGASLALDRGLGSNARSLELIDFVWGVSGQLTDADFLDVSIRVIRGAKARQALQSRMIAGQTTAIDGVPVQDYIELFETAIGPLIADPKALHPAFEAPESAHRVRTLIRQGVFELVQLFEIAGDRDTAAKYHSMVGRPGLPIFPMNNRAP